MKDISYQEAKEKGLEFIKKHCEGEIEEQVELPNHYFIGDLGNGEKLNVIVMDFNDKCIGFGIGMFGGMVMITQEPHKYIDKIIKDYEEKVLKPMLKEHES